MARLLGLKGLNKFLGRAQAGFSPDKYIPCPTLASVDGILQERVGPNQELY